MRTSEEILQKIRNEEARRERVAKELKEEAILGWKAHGGGFVSPCGRWKTYCATDGDYFHVDFSDDDTPALDVPRMRLSATGNTIRGAFIHVMTKIRIHCRPLRLPWETIRTGVFPSGLDKVEPKKKRATCRAAKRTKRKAP